jgi:hypothetical protein
MASKCLLAIYYIKFKKINMRNLKFLCFFLTYSIYSQNTLEKSFNTIEAGILGVSLTNESKLNNFFTIKSSLTLGATLWFDRDNDKLKPALLPILSIMPKYYYNLERRKNKNKKIKFNSANYVGLELNYVPSWFVISSSEQELSVIDHISIIPKYGFRRNISNSNFNYELNFGVGYFNYLNNYLKKEDNHRIIPNLEFKIGYSF